MTHIAIFASGKGTNAEAIISYFKNSSAACVSLIVCNNAEAGVIEVARRNGIPVKLITRESFYHTTELLEVLKQHSIGFIALAGFLWLVPKYVLDEFPNKIVNIHPALLPKHGGKGMYGNKVHEAVLHAKDRKTGITVHYVNERFDEGEIIFQAMCSVQPDDDAASLEAKVHRLEHHYYPRVIEKLLINQTVAT